MTTIRMKRLLPALLLATTLVCAPGAEAQLRSFSVYSEYAAPLAKRSDVMRIDAVGGGVQIAYTLAGNVSIGLKGGYALYSLEQTDQLVRWGWTFWNDRYLNKIQADMRADPMLSAVIGSVQKMDLIPVAVQIDYAIDVSERLVVMPSVSGGMSFYTRRLYADETWTKKFPAADYSFTYNFRNYAPAKKGSVLSAGIGCTLKYRIFSDVSVTAGASYVQHLSAGNDASYAAFPVENEVDLRIGLDFHY